MTKETMSPRPSRRLFLKGGGVTLALPFLPSALWSRRAGAAICKPPRRFVAWFAPNGMNMPDWTPTTAGMGWTAPPILAPLEPIRNKVLIVTGLDHQAIAQPMPSPTGAAIDPQAAGTGCFLNMVPVDGHLNDSTRTSIDQALLPVLNSADCGPPPLASLQLGIQGGNGSCGGMNCSFSRTISWSRGIALPTNWDPGLVFDQMFPGGASEDAARRAAQRKSILDAVVGAANSLAVRLSPADRHKLDEHTTLVRNLETRLQRLGKSGVGNAIGMSCTPPDRPASPGVLSFNGGLVPSAIVESEIPICVDLMALAFACDITRAITFMLGNGKSNNDYGFLFGGVSTPHYDTASVGSDPATLAEVTTIDTYEIAQAAAFLQKLDGVIEADGQSILDHTTFYLGSDISNVVANNAWDMPVILAGGASHGLKADGRHINYIPQMPFPRPQVGPRNPNQNTGQVFISILQAHGIMQDTFGLATGGALPELLP